MKQAIQIFFAVAMIRETMQLYKVVNTTGKLETITLLYLLLATVMFFICLNPKRQW